MQSRAVLPSWHANSRSKWRNAVMMPSDLSAGEKAARTKMLRARARKAVVTKKRQIRDTPARLALARFGDPHVSPHTVLNSASPNQ